MQSVEPVTESIMYWLSLNTQVRALAERLLERFAVTVGDAPASAEHHHAKPDGLDPQSMKAPLSLAGTPELTRSYPLSLNSEVGVGFTGSFCRFLRSSCRQRMQLRRS
jgi:hypothetical protein